MIKILHSGIYNTVQDQGRFGYAKMGVPVSGFLDTYAAELGNTLLNNQKNAAMIEITFGQGKFQFLKTTIFCLTGADFSPQLNGRSLKMNCLYQAEANAELSFGKRNYGARTYLAIKGGIQTEVVLNSRSFLPGITRQRLEKGDTLKVLEKPTLLETKYSKVKKRTKHFTSALLEGFPGPEFEKLNDVQKQRLSQPFTISADNNRVGYRLKEAIENKLKPILTSSVLPGTIQLTPSGGLIILMKDCQVSGGYPRVLQLSDYAIAQLSQKMAGEEVQLKISE